MSLLLLVEHDGVVVSDKTLRALTALKSLAVYGENESIDALVVGYTCQKAAEQMAHCEGIGTVFVVDDVLHAHALAEPLAAQVAAHGDKYRLIVAAASSYGKNVMPRVAALLDRPQISEITSVLGRDTFERPIYAGNALSVVQMIHPCGVMTVRSSAFSPVSLDRQGSSVSIQHLPPIVSHGLPLSEYVKHDFTASDKPDLGSARIVISGGRALGSAEAFNTLIGGLADVLGAAVGASRAAVDAGYAPNDLQVGQTGQSVAPEVYMAIGISGAIQHL